MREEDGVVSRSLERFRDRWRKADVRGKLVGLFCVVGMDKDKPSAVTRHVINVIATPTICFVTLFMVVDDKFSISFSILPRSDGDDVVLMGL